jgi:hypothetical protein
VIDHSLAQICRFYLHLFFWNSRVSPRTIEGLFNRNAELLLFLLVSFSFMLCLVAEKMYKEIEEKEEKKKKLRLHGD